MDKTKGKILSLPITIGALVILMAIGVYLALYIRQTNQIESPTTAETPSVTNQTTPENSDSSDTSDTSDETAEDNSSDENKEKEITFERIENQLTVKQAHNYIIQSQKEWSGLWLSKANNLNDFQTPVIDFNKSTVLAIFGGEKGSSGYSVQFSKIIETTDGIKAYYRNLSPATGDISLTVMTYPSDIIKIPKTNKQVEFIGSE